MGAESIIQINQVTKSFGSHQAIKGVSLDVPRGSFTTLLGPSGCGKTTLMRLIAGFHEPDSGDIYIDGVRMNEVPAYKRDTPLVFQEYALFPHMTVYDNISYGLKLRKTPKDIVRAKVAEMLEMFGLQGMERRFPKEMSGGQQQRVAFARALITGQQILLMDEPLSNLDAKMRVEVRSELRELQQRTGVTAVFVTHDQDEALSLSDRIAVFNQGEICQVGTPWEIYFRPQTRFVADFVGVANFMEGEAVGSQQEAMVVKCQDRLFTLNEGGTSLRKGEPATLVIRPECVSISAASGGQEMQEGGWSGSIRKSSFLGKMIRYWVDCGPLEWIVDDTNPIRVLEGQVHLSLDTAKIHALPAAR